MYNIMASSHSGMAICHNEVTLSQYEMASGHFHEYMLKSIEQHFLLWTQDVQKQFTPGSLSSGRIIDTKYQKFEKTDIELPATGLYKFAFKQILIDANLSFIPSCILIYKYIFECNLVLGCMGMSAVTIGGFPKSLCA